MTVTEPPSSPSPSTPLPSSPLPSSPDTAADAHTRTPGERTLHVLWQSVSWLLLIAAFAVLCLTILVPKIAGGRPYSVLTSSMRPDYPPGSLVVVKPKPASEITVGDVITYQIRSGQPGVVTHRVTAIEDGPDGQPRFTTRGDANGVADDDEVRPVQVRGALWYSIPYLGYVNTWFSGARRTTIIFILAGLLFAYGLWQFYAGWRDDDSEEDGSQDEADVPAAADDTPTDAFPAAPPNGVRR